MAWTDRWKAIKAALRFSPSSGGGWISYATAFANTNRDYATLAGDLKGSSLVMAAVNWVGRALPEAPLRVMRAGQDGQETEVVNHPATKLLKRPNPFYSGAALWKTFALSWITTGNPYFLKVRAQAGNVVELWYCPPWMIEPRWPADGRAPFISHYEYKVDGQAYRIEVSDVLHFRDGGNPDNQGRTGLSPVASVLREIYADNETAQYQALLMQNGGVPPVILSLKEGVAGIKQEDLVRIKQDYIRSTQGDERGKAFVSGLAINVDRIAFNPGEMDLKVLRRLPESRLAAVIGIPAIVLGLGSGDDTSTYNNTQQADERATENYLTPLWGYIEDELTHQLGPDFGFGENERFAFDLSEVRCLQEDRDKLVARECLAYEKGVKTRAEARAAMNLDFTPEDEVYFVLPQKEVEEEPEPPPFVDGEVIEDEEEMPMLNGKDRTRLPA